MRKITVVLDEKDRESLLDEIINRLNILGIASSGPLNFPAVDNLVVLNLDYTIYSYNMGIHKLDIGIMKKKNKYFCNIFIKEKPSLF